VPIGAGVVAGPGRSHGNTTRSATIWDVPAAGPRTRCISGWMEPRRRERPSWLAAVGTCGSPGSSSGPTTRPDGVGPAFLSLRPAATRHYHLVIDPSCSAGRRRISSSPPPGARASTHSRREARRDCRPWPGRSVHRGVCGQDNDWQRAAGPSLELDEVRCSCRDLRPQLVSLGVAGEAGVNIVLPLTDPETALARRFEVQKPLWGFAWSRPCPFSRGTTRVGRSPTPRSGSYARPPSSVTGGTGLAWASGTSAPSSATPAVPF